MIILRFLVARIVPQQVLQDLCSSKCNQGQKFFFFVAEGKKALILPPMADRKVNTDTFFCSNEPDIWLQRHVWAPLYVSLRYVNELLTEGVILALGPIDLSIYIDPQEKLLERKQLPLPYVPLEMIVAAHVPTLWPPGLTWGTSSGPGPWDDHSLRDVKWNPESLWVGKPRSVSVEMAGGPGQGAGEKRQCNQERQRQGGKQCWWARPRTRTSPKPSPGAGRGRGSLTPSSSPSDHGSVLCGGLEAASEPGTCCWGRG